MLQWIPGSDREIIYNDREERGFVSRVLDVETGQTRTLPEAVYTLSPDGRNAIGTDFRRINHTRPGYGYAGHPDPNREVNAPDDAGIYTLDLATGASRLIISIAQVAAIPYPHGDISPARHWFDGRAVFIDSAHVGNGRQIYRIDIGELIDAVQDST